MTGLISELPQAELTDLGKAIDGGTVQTILSYGEDLTAAGLTEEQLAKVTILYLGTHANSTSEKAKVVLPTLTVFEKNGSFINQQFRLQRFMQAVPAPEGVVSDLRLLSALREPLSEEQDASPEIDQIWKELAAEVPALTGLIFLRIPPEGLLLEVSEDLRNLPYCEGKTLHYEPQGEVASSS